MSHGRPIWRGPRRSTIVVLAARGCSSMVEPQSSKLMVRVRFPSSPPPCRRWSQRRHSHLWVHVGKTTVLRHERIRPNSGCKFPRRRSGRTRPACCTIRKANTEIRLGVGAVLSVLSPLVGCAPESKGSVVEGSEPAADERTNSDPVLEQSAPTAAAAAQKDLTPNVKSRSRRRWPQVPRRSPVCGDRAFYCDKR